jgi:hypothetical protein
VVVVVVVVVLSYEKEKYVANKLTTFFQIT